MWLARADVFVILAVATYGGEKSMKLAKVTIDNFRHIEHLELDFTDSFGRVRDVSLIVGPNMCGKTTILDAMAAALGPMTQLPTLRPGFKLSPKAVVRRNTLCAKVTCEVRFTEEEISATQELFTLAEDPARVKDQKSVKLTWTYPDAEHKYGHCNTNPNGAWPLFQGRLRAARLLSTRRTGLGSFRKVGGIFTFDQQRSGMGKSIPPQILEIIGGTTPENLGDPEGGRISDPRTILLSLWVRSMAEPADPTSAGDFALIKEKYAEICHPHKIIGATRDEVGELDLEFGDGKYSYGYDGLSSGEQMALLLLIRMVTDHIHQSIVLIDEIELHQHPTWQRKLLHLVPQMGQGNQVIATTHSPYLRDVMPPGTVIELGELEDSSLTRPQPHG